MKWVFSPSLLEANRGSSGDEIGKALASVSTNRIHGLYNCPIHSLFYILKD